MADLALDVSWSTVLDGNQIFSGTLGEPQNIQSINYRNSSSASLKSILALLLVQLSDNAQHSKLLVMDINLLHLPKLTFFAWDLYHGSISHHQISKVVDVFVILSKRNDK